MPKRNRSKPRPNALEAKALAVCAACGKKNYASKQDAKRGAARIHPGIRMRFYQCGPWWHMTSQNSDVTAWYREHPAVQEEQS